MTEKFDKMLDRIHSDSMKWNVYPQDVLPMWVADMDFLSPPEVIEALQNRVNHGVFGYAMNPKMLDEVVIQWAGAHYDLQISTENILYVPGVVTGINLSARALLNQGEGILYQPPIYPPFFQVSHSPPSDKRLGNLSDTDRRLNPRWDTGFLQGILNGQGIDHGSQHSHIIAGDSFNIPGIGTTSEDISATNHQADLEALVND